MLLKSIKEKKRTLLKKLIELNLNCKWILEIDNL